MQKIKQIVLLIESPFNYRDYQRFGIEIFIKNGFQVSVWDCTGFLHPQVYQFVRPPDEFEFKNCMQFCFKKKAIDAINSCEQDTFFIVLLGYGIKSWHLFRALSKKKIPYGLFGSNTIPSVDLGGNRHALLKKIRSLTPRKVANKIFLKIPPKLLKINAASFLLCGGASTVIKRPLVDNNTHLLWIHTLDYDLYLNSIRLGNNAKSFSFLKETSAIPSEENSCIALQHEAVVDRNASEIEERVAIFLDEYAPFHPDFIHQGTTSPVTPEKYYPALCHFFDLIELEFDLKVVIAAHPRSKYEEMPDFFNGRKVIRGKTLNLVQKSMLVLLHCSTSINFSVLYKKPMVFITTDELERSLYGKMISYFGSYFKKTPINISNYTNINIFREREFYVYSEGYSKYKHNHIKKHGTENTPFWQAVCDQLCNEI